MNQTFNLSKTSSVPAEDNSKLLELYRLQTYYLENENHMLLTLNQYENCKNKILM